METRMNSPICARSIFFNCRSDSGPPIFAYDQPPYGYYHIRYESPCREGGDGYSYDYPDEEDMDGLDRVYDTLVDIGADEYCCEETWHEDDWTYDGVINYDDYAIISRAWLSCDPNVYTGADPNLWVPWNKWGKTCDLYDDEKIDLSDLIEFCEDDPQVWLWQACWRQNYFAVYGMMDSGGGGMMMSMPMAESLYSAQSLQAESAQSSYESSPEELAENIVLILDFLEEVLEEDNLENEEGILEMKAYLEDWLDKIKS